eukprot:1787061-Rhodomonas_salina.1
MHTVDLFEVSLNHVLPLRHRPDPLISACTQSSRSAPSRPPDSLDAAPALEAGIGASEWEEQARQFLKRYSSTAHKLTCGCAGGWAEGRGQGSVVMERSVVSPRVEVASWTVMMGRGQ